jgi:release factor glutamine methyltransferase
MIKQLLAEGKAKLTAANLNPIDAEILLANILGLTRMELHNPIKLETATSEIDSVQLVELFNIDLDRRISSEPVQYITGNAYFRDLELEVGPGVLIPRPETENLVSYVLSQIANRKDEISVIDLGAGSGAIALAIATENPNTRVIAVEKSAAALHWLRKNVAKHVPDLRVVESDVTTALEGIKCDVVVTNPPYVPNNVSLPDDVKNYEPREALFGGETGLELPQIFITAAARLLKPDGLLVVEHAEEHGAGMAALLHLDFDQIELHYDLNQRPRFTSARRKS